MSKEDLDTVDSAGAQLARSMIEAPFQVRIENFDG
jgi:hypothetical protein